MRAREIIDGACGVGAPVNGYRALAAGILLVSIAMPVGEPTSGAAREPYVTDERPALLSYDDLIELGFPRPRGPDLEGRLENLLNTPLVNNEAFYRGAEPFRPVEPGLHDIMRVVSWNIERGLRFDLIRALFTDDREFRSHVEHDAALDEKERRELEREIAMLRSADVLVLQEVDWGIERTGYTRIAEELGRALDMNWAYGVEFVEVDPFNLGIEVLAGGAAEKRAEMRRGIGVDEARYEGLLGIAVLSRYPIRSARLLPLRVQAHDWFAGEMKNASLVESAKREASERLYLTPIGREIRRGGRTLLVVELDVPDLPLGVVTIAATHLESRADAAGRRKQIAEVLSYLGDIPHPVVLAGDMNTSGRDGTPTSWKHEVYRRVGNESFWATQGLKYASGLGMVLDLVRGGIGFLRTHTDPTVASIPVVSPNAERGFFKVLEDFRFADGGAFDFRGDRTRAMNRAGGTLANSNERDRKGFAATFEAERPVGHTGKFKLDWIFVKAFATHPRDRYASYRFAPHCGRTMEILNKSVTPRLSDHAPITVDLPLGVPGERNDCRAEGGR